MSQKVEPGDRVMCKALDGSWVPALCLKFMPHNDYVYVERDDGITKSMSVRDVRPMSLLEQLADNA